jgi:hypothetical protein
MPLDFDLVIPSRDGLPYTLIIAREYARLGVRRRYFIDGRSSRLFRSLSTALLAPADIIFPSGDSIEQILPQIVAGSNARWVLRIDDDEAPSSALLAWLTHMTPDRGKTVIALPRRAVRFDNETAVYARSIPKVMEHDYQYRCFLREGVVFEPTLHTAGIKFALTDIAYAPPECCLYHFDWIVRTRAEREAKLSRYERLAPGSWKTFVSQYLPEHFCRSEYDYAPLDDLHAIRLAKRLRAGQHFYSLAGRAARHLAFARPRRSPAP